LLISKFPCQIFHFLKKEIKSKETFLAAQKNKTSFIRNRKLNLENLIWFFLSQIRSSIQVELNRYFGELHNDGMPYEHITDAAFCKAKDKLNPNVFRHLINKAAKFYYETKKIKTWRKLKVLAIDGSLCRLPHVDDLDDHFGTWKGHNQTPRGMCRGTLVYDALNNITTDALYTPKDQGERKAASNLLDNMPKDSILLMDRGYPAFWLFHEIIEKGQDFLVRAKMDENSFITDFWNSNKTDMIVEFPTKRRYYKGSQYNDLTKKGFKVRLIKSKDFRKRPMVLMTTILDQSVSRDELVDLYKLRWSAEENYKVLKSKLNVEHISSKKPNGAYCDFYAKTLFLIIGQMIASKTSQHFEQIQEDYVHPCKINMSKYLSHFKDFFLKFYKKKCIEKTSKSFIELVIKYHCPIRKGRHFERGKNRVDIPRYILNYRPLS